MSTAYEKTPFDQNMLSANGTQRQNDTVKSQCADRPKLSAHEAIRQIRGLLQQVDTDLSTYFNTEAYRELMKSIVWRVNDAAMLALIEAWLEIAIEKATPQKHLREVLRAQQPCWRP